MKYQVRIVKPVLDYLRAYVEVDAASEAEAEAKACEVDPSELDFEFWTSGDTLEETTYEASPLGGVS